MDQQKLRDKIEKIEALFAGTTYEGERHAAGLALERLRALLEKEKSSDPAIEHKFTRFDPFSKKLLIALLRRYGLEPYRYHGQKYTTLNVKCSKRFMNDVIWPEFVELDTTLTAHLNEVVDRIIAEHIHGSVEGEREVAQLAAG